MNQMNDKPSWRPVFRGEDRERARAAARKLAEGIDPPAAWAREGKRSAWPFWSGVSSGLAGLSLLHAYRARLSESTCEADLAVDCLDHALSPAAVNGTLSMLFDGYLGSAWARAHLERTGFLEQPADDDYIDLDDELTAYLAHWRKGMNFDLMRGLVGVGVYALERQPPAATLLERVVDHLVDSAEFSPDGVVWHTPASLLAPADRERLPGDGYFNLGVAHGLPGVMAFLARARASGVVKSSLDDLIDGAIDWMTSQRLPESSTSMFPAYVGPGIKPEPARSGWCHGDPGIACALLTTARVLPEPRIENLALAAARRALERPNEETRIDGPSLCHGAAGLGLIFARLWNLTDNEEFAEASRSWFRQTLQFVEELDGLAEPPAAVGSRRDDGSGWFFSRGLLHGDCGVSLALLAAASDLEPEWDRVLLLSAIA